MNMYTDAHIHIFKSTQTERNTYARIHIYKHAHIHIYTIIQTQKHNLYSSTDTHIGIYTCTTTERCK